MMFRSMIMTFGVRLFSAVLNFLIIVLLSRMLGPDGKGICTRYIAIISNALIFCDFIGGPALVYLAARHNIKSMLLPSYLWSALTGSAVILIFFFLNKITVQELPHLMVLSLLNSMISIHQNILSGKMDFAKVNLIILLQALLTFIFLKTLFVYGNNFPLAYVYALYMAWGPLVLLGLIFSLSKKDQMPLLSARDFINKSFGYGIANQAGHLLQFFNQRLSYFLLPEGALGIFSNATSVGESLWMVSNSMATVQYGKISNTDNKIYAERFSFVLLKVNLILCLAGALVLAFLPDAFFEWVFGKDFSGIHQALFWLSPGLFFFSGYLILGHHFSGRGKFVLNLIPISAGLLFTIAGLIYFYLNHVDLKSIHAAILTSLAYAGNFFTAFIVFMKQAKLGTLSLLNVKEDVVFLKTELFSKKTSGKKD